MPVPRYLPDVPFPPYTFVPGRAPHPYTDPRGHAFGQPPPPAVALEASDWSANVAYLRGIDCFNHGYYWEAHEAWESAWNGCGRKGMVADFLKALIKLAAAGVKIRERVPAGVARHASRAGELLRGVQEEARCERFCGLDLAPLITFAEEAALTPNPEPIPEAGPLFAFVLQPK